MSQILPLLFLELLGLWALAGLYGEALARRYDAPERKGSLSAMISGGPWLRTALIWGVVQDHEQYKDQQRESALQVGPDNSAGWEAAGQSASSPPPGPAFSLPQPGASPAPPPQPAPAWSNQPAAGPASVVSRTAPPLTPDSAQTPPPPPDWSASSSPPTWDDEDSSSPPLPQAPEKLPKRPALGAVKCLCPMEGSEQKYGRDAICKSCKTANPWLVAAWGLSEKEPEPPAREIPLPPAAPSNSLLPPVTPNQPSGPVDWTAGLGGNLPPSSSEYEEASIVTSAPSSPLPPPPPQSFNPALPTSVQLCRSCQRRSVADLRGDCALCGRPISGVSS